MADDKDGLLVRFIRQYVPSADGLSLMMDRALWLANGDDRDLPFVDKLRDALTFLRQRVH